LYEYYYLGVRKQITNEALLLPKTTLDVPLLVSAPQGTTMSFNQSIDLLIVNIRINDRRIIQLL